MENNDKTEKLIEELSRYVNQSLLFVETKHASIIAFCAVILGEVVVPFIKDDKTNCIFDDIRCFSLIIAFLALACSMLISLYAFFPKKPKEKQEKKTLYYNIIVRFFVPYIKKLIKKLKDKQDKKSEKKIEKGTNLFRCETLECFSEKELAHYLMAENEENPLDRYEKEVIKHIITTSKAAARKYRMFRISITILLISTAVLCIIALLDKLNIL